MRTIQLETKKKTGDHRESGVRKKVQGTQTLTFSGFLGGGEEGFWPEEERRRKHDEGERKEGKGSRKTTKEKDACITGRPLVGKKTRRGRVQREDFFAQDAGKGKVDVLRGDRGRAKGASAEFLQGKGRKE